MKLTARARQALRLMVELARLNAVSKPVNLVKVSQLLGVPRRTLEQLVIALKGHYLVRGVAGRKGGYVLARHPADITVGQVLEAVAGPADLTVCVGDPDFCVQSEFCKCRSVFVLLSQQVKSVFNQFTLADVVAGVQEERPQVAQLMED